MDFSRWLYYDETSPSCLRWAVDVYSGKHKTRLNVSKDSVAGYINSRGYWVVCVGGKNRRCNRVVYELFNGKLGPKEEVDHIDGDNGRNVITNLRAVETKVNLRNRKAPTTNTSGVVGVSYQSCSKSGRGYWRANWQRLEDGKVAAKLFSVQTYGNDEAFRLACEHRAKMIDELNAQGAGYTERHGS